MLYIHTYGVSTYVRLEFIKPSASEVVGPQFFLALALFRVSLGLNHVLFSSPHSAPSPLFSLLPKMNSSL